MATSKEELLKNKQERLGNYLQEVLRTIEKEKAHVFSIGQGASALLDSLHVIGQINRQEFLVYWVNYQENFLASLSKIENHREQLEFVFTQINHLQLEIGNAKINNEPVLKTRYENVLTDLVLPIKEQLKELVTLENEVGPLKKTEPIAPAMAIEFSPTIAEKDPAPQSNTVEEKEEAHQINIPINIIDKALETKTGKPLNNAPHIAAGRKFTWSDDRIPDLLGIFLLEKHLILDYHLTLVQDFFRTGKCKAKIAFDGNANILTTMLYDLISNNYLTISTTFLAERIESVFVKKGDTSSPLITKNSLKANLKPVSIDRRLKEGNPNYPKLIVWLKKNYLLE